MRSFHCPFCPNRKRLRLRPSSFFLLTTGMPAQSASVGNKSIAAAMGFICVPFLILLGQRTSNGERTPPSSVEPLRPFMSPFQRTPFGPLSWKKTTMVSSAIFSSSSFLRMRPTFQSMFSHIASAQRRCGRFSFLGSRLCIEIFLSLNLFHQRSGTCIGLCGVLYGR